LLGLVLGSFLEACECRGFWVPVSVGFGGCGLVSVIWDLGVVSEAVWFRTWAVGEEFQILHWNMLNWFVLCSTVLRGYLFGRAVRVVPGGVMLWMERSDVGRVIGGWVCGLVTSRCLVFFGGFCVRARGGSWCWSWVLMRVCGLLWVVDVGEGESFFGSVSEVSCVCLLRLLREVRWVCWVGLERLCMRLVTYVSSSPVMTYLR
jgi:hypothetical protein